jgi:ribA/ribD-fused uncharacterized protein
MQAVNLMEPRYEVIDGDMMVVGSLPSSGGVLALHRRLFAQEEHVASLNTFLPTSRLSSAPCCLPAREAAAASAADDIGTDSTWHLHADAPAAAAARRSRQRRGAKGKVEFYKAWDEWGALSNFSPHPIDMAPGMADMQSSATSASSHCSKCHWPSVEHFYQAQKFTHAATCDNSEVVRRSSTIVEAILHAASPEEAARIGRLHERLDPSLMRADWSSAKMEVMLAALHEKFLRHSGPQQMLLSTAEDELELIEASPSDYYWGQGKDATGQNLLGRLLMQVRRELVAAGAGQQGGGVAQAIRS